MAEFLTTKGIASEIEKIIRKAKKEIVLVSPYLKINKTFYERLGEASEKKIPITIIYGKDHLKSNEKDSLYKLSSLNLFYYDDLHAKCFYNEEKLIITSMNMYDFSEKNNREMGVLIEKKKDNNLYQEAVDEAESILRLSDKVLINNMEKSWDTEKKIGTKNKGLGFCIRCESRIDYNPDKPYCFDCFFSWNQFENPFYTENVCHHCGEYNSSSMEKPECWSCYKETN